MIPKNTLTQHILNVIFDNKKELSNNQLLQNKIIETKKSLGIKVQSVALPIDYDAFNFKTKDEVLNWLQYKIQNVHTANYLINIKPDIATKPVKWYDDKLLNQRFLQTKKMYGDS
jgi:hypothetical protein